MLTGIPIGYKVQTILCVQMAQQDTWFKSVGYHYARNLRRSQGITTLTTNVGLI